MLANIPRLKELMKRNNLDAVIATCPENMTYLSGFWAMSQWVRRGPQAYVLFPQETEQPCQQADGGHGDGVDQAGQAEDLERRDDHDESRDGGRKDPSNRIWSGADADEAADARPERRVQEDRDEEIGHARDLRNASRAVCPRGACAAAVAPRVSQASY